MRKTNMKALAAATFAALGLAIGTSSTGAGTIFDFPLSEGSGVITMDTVQGLKGWFGAALDPAVDNVTLSTDSPSGKPGDGSMVTHGKGFLVAADTNGVLNVLTNGPITMEVWIKVDETSAQKSNEGMMGFGSSFKMGSKQGSHVFTLLGKADITNTAAPYLLTGWTHYAAAWEPGVGVTFYVNGIPSFTPNTNTTARAPLNNFLALGSEGANTLATLVGAFDRARIHHALLTADQLDSDPANPKPAYPSTLVAFNFDEGSLPCTNSVAPQMSTVPVTAVRDTFFPGPEWTADSAIVSNESSLFFDGTGKAVIALDPNNLVTANGFNGGYTLETWVKLPPEFVPANRMVMMAYLSPALGVTFSIDANKTLHTTFLGKKNITSSALVPTDGNWHHVAAVWEQGKEVRFYVDTQLAATSAYTDVAGARNGDAQLVIGSELSTSTRFTGWLDRVRFSNEPLTPDQFMYQRVPGMSAPIRNKSLVSGQSGTIDFSIANYDLFNAGSLTLSATVDNSELFPAGSLTFSGSGPGRTLTLTPAAGKAGKAFVTVQATDGAARVVANTIAVNVLEANVVALWDFNSDVRDYTTASGSWKSLIGQGLASEVNVGSSTLSKGMTPVEDLEIFDNTQWRLGTFSAPYTGNKTSGAEFRFSTVGFQNIQFTWEHWNSATGSKYWRVQYALDGYTFQDHTVFAAPDSTTTFKGIADFSDIPGADNNPNFAVRFVAEFAGTATGQIVESDNYIGARANPPANYGTAGTLWLDMVKFTGEPYNPATPVSLQVTKNAAGQIEISWSATASGTLQSTPNLTTPNWQVVAQTPAVVDGKKVVTVANPTGTMFFRLNMQ